MREAEVQVRSKKQVREVKRGQPEKERVEQQSPSPLPPSNLPKVLPAYLHTDTETGPTEHMNTQDYKSYKHL